MSCCREHYQYHQPYHRGWQHKGILCFAGGCGKEECSNVLGWHRLRFIHNQQDVRTQTHTRARDREDLSDKRNTCRASARTPTYRTSCLISPVDQPPAAFPCNALPPPKANSVGTNTSKTRIREIGGAEIQGASLYVLKPIGMKHKKVKIAWSSQTSNTKPNHHNPIHT